MSSNLVKSFIDPKLILYASGIFVCYFVFGLYQEKITRSPYGVNKEKFTCAQTLVFVSCVINAIFARIIMVFQKNARDTVPARQYIACAFTYLTAMVSSVTALRHVNYPTQVIGKSCKPIPVMVFGVLFARKSYPLRRYVFISMVVIGVALFMWKDSAASKTPDASGYMGYLLIILSLAMDGCTGALQDRMRAEHQLKPTNIMYKINLWSSLLLAIALIGTGELAQFIEFLQRHPIILGDMVIFSALGCFGQLFIFLTVVDYGPLPCSVVTTTRKFFTVLFSILYFGNSATYRQMAGIVLVFTGLGLDSVKGKDKKPAVKEHGDDIAEPLIAHDKIQVDLR